MPKTPEAASASTDNEIILSVAKGGGFIAAGDVFNLGSRFVVSLIMARTLGVEDYGAYNLAVSLAFVVAGLGNFGLDAAMERYVAVFRRRGDTASLQGTVQFGLGVTLIGALVVSTGLFLVAQPLAQQVFDNRDLAPLFQLMAFIIPVIAVTTLLASVARGFKRMGQSAFSEDILQPLVRMVLIGMLAVTGFSAYVAGVVLGISYMAAVVALVALLKARFRNPLPPRAATVHVREISLFSLPFWLAGILTQIRKNIQPVLLGAFNTIASVGVMSVVTNANMIGRTANLAISKALRPTLAELFDDDDRRQLARLYQETTRWTLASNLPIFLVMLLYPSAILMLFGEDFAAGATALVILAWAELVNAATGTAGAVIDMSGFNVVKIVNKSVWVVTSLGLSFWLIPPYGVNGAAVAVLVSTALTQVMRAVEVWFLAGLSPYNRRLLKPIIAGAAAFGAGYAGEALVPSTAGLLGLLFNASIVCAVYGAVLVALGLSPEDRVVLGAIGQRLGLTRGLPHRGGRPAGQEDGDGDPASTTDSRQGSGGRGKLG